MENERFFAANGSVLAYARAALRLGLDSVRAMYVDISGSWWSLRVEVTSPLSGSARTAEIDALPVLPPYGLSGRELDTLTLVAAGLSNQEIAARLGNGLKTVATHVERILAKLGQSTRAGAAALAAEQGILRLPVPGSGYGLGDLTVGLVNEAVHLGVRDGLLKKANQRHVGRPSRTPIVLGSALPLIGVAAFDGEDMSRGAALAVAESNARGGAAGREIQHIIAPYDPMDPGSAMDAIDNLRGADAVTCGYVLENRAIPEILHNAAALGSPFLHTLTSRDSIDWVKRQPGSLGSIFQASSPEDVYGQGFLRFLLQFAPSLPGFRGKVAFIEMGRDYVGRVPADIKLKAQSFGFSVVSIEAGSSESEWASAAATVREADVDVAYLSCFVEENLLAFLREGARDRRRTLLYSLYVPSSAGFLERAGSVAVDLVWATVVGLYADDFGAGFHRRFSDFHGLPPGRSNAGVHYDLVNLLAQTWAVTRGPRPLDDVLATLRTTVHRGVTGAYFFGTPGQSGRAYPDECRDASLAQAHLMLQVQNRQHRIIGPRGFAERSLVVPGRTSAE